MQDAKEDSTSSVKAIHENRGDRESKYFKAIHIFAFFFISLSLSFIALSFANLFRVQTNVDSARYLLSALVQSQAAILAIVISLTLIAVQLTASAYSPRVIKIFSESLGWQALFVLYGISIFYGLLVLKMIKGATNSSVDLSPITYLDISLKGHISLAYILGIVTFMALILYMRGIIGFLNPTTIINRLAKDITKDSLLNAEEDPIQPIIDIVHGSIMKYDIAMTRVGLKTVTEWLIEIIDPNGEKEISERFCKHLERVGRLAISRDDEESAVEVIANMKNFGESTVEKSLKNSTWQTIVSLKEISIIAVKKELAGVAVLGARYLGEVGSTAAEKGFGTVGLQAVWSLGEVGSTAAEKGLEDAAFQAALSLKGVGSTAAEKGLEVVAVQVVRSLRSLGEVGGPAIEKGLGDSSLQAIVDSLEEVGRTAAEKGLEAVAVEVARALREIGIASAKKGLEGIVFTVAVSLEKIGRTYAEKGLESATKKVAEALAKLTFPSEEIVKTLIHDFESNLGDHDHKSFQKFKELYEQELKRLRTEQQK